MFSYSKFEKQLPQGQKYELEALKYLEYDRYEHENKYRKEYDLIIYKDEQPIKIEVKSDRQASQTNNLAIEYECNRQPSGISVTEADYWIYFIVFESLELDHQECYKIPIDDLKTIVKSCNKVAGGDGGRSRLYLLNKNRIKNYLVQKIK